MWDTGGTWERKGAWIINAVGGFLGKGTSYAATFLSFCGAMLLIITGEKRIIVDISC